MWECWYVSDWVGGRVSLRVDKVGGWKVKVDKKETGLDTSANARWHGWVGERVNERVDKGVARSD